MGALWFILHFYYAFLFGSWTAPDSEQDGEVLASEESFDLGSPKVTGLLSSFVPLLIFFNFWRIFRQFRILIKPQSKWLSRNRENLGLALAAITVALLMIQTFNGK